MRQDYIIFTAFLAKDASFKLNLNIIPYYEKLFYLKF
jgi:hypothetical protein